MHTVRTPSSLLLLRLLSLSLSLSPLLPHPHIPRITPRPPQLRIRTLLTLRHISLLHLADPKLLPYTLLNPHHTADLPHNLILVILVVRVSLNVFGGGVEFLVLSGFTWEENEAGLVGFEAGDVQGEGFLVGGLAPGVDGDADCGG